MLKKIGFYLLALIVLALVLVYVGTTLFFLISPNHYFSFTAENSMSPALTGGSLAFLKVLEEEEELEVGQIVAFTYQRYGDDETIIHRIIEEDKDKACFLTKGDNNEAIDFLCIADECETICITKEDIRGVYLFHIPSFTKVWIFFHFFFCFLLLFLIITMRRRRKLPGGMIEGGVIRPKRRRVQDG